MVSSAFSIAIAERISPDIAKVSATAATVYNNLIPITSLLLAMALGQEGFQWARVIGMAVAVAGLFVAQIQPKSAANS